MSRSENGRLAGLYAMVAALHVAGFALFLSHDGPGSTLAGLALAAYLLGVRHAFDADHIAAVDDTVRLLVQRGDSPLGVGFFFSLGHSTVVLAAALAVAAFGAGFADRLAAVQETATLVGAAVSASFLLVVGLLNLRILVGIARAWPEGGPAGHAHDADDGLAPRPGRPLRRRVRRRLRGFVRRSWHLYPIGVLFGLGFDTASEIALLAMTIGASAAQLPLAAVLCLPVLFAAGMSAIDTTDGVFMCRAYRWALDEPRRRVVYNLATTGLSVAFALVVGGVEAAQVAARLWPRAAVPGWLAGLDVAPWGVAAVAVLATLWLLAALLARRRRAPARSLVAPLR